MPITLQELTARLGAADTPAKVVGILRPVGIETALESQSRAQARVSGSVLAVRTGRLRQSIRGSVNSPGGGVIDVSLRAGGRVGNKSVPYAAAHEFGATIRPRRARMLRIPLPAALTGAGVDRFATPLRQTGAGLFYLRRSRRGSLILFHRVTGEPWYVLKDKTRIPERPYLRPSLLEAGRDVPARIAKRLSAALTASAGGV
jgi:hypothetical protein